MLVSQIKLHVLVRIVTFVAAAGCVCYPGVSASALLQAMPPKKIFAPALAARAAKSKAAKAKAKTQTQQPKASKATKTSSAAKKCDQKPSELPIHVPEPCPLCETCSQHYGDDDKDCLPLQIPLKWRSFNVKLVAQEVTQGLRTQPLAFTREALEGRTHLLNGLA